MKKVFALICFSLLLISKPAIAQTETLNKEQAESLSKNLVPIMLDQLKSVIGIDIMAFTKPDLTIEELLGMPAFSPGGNSLRADGTFNIKPTTVSLDLGTLVDGLDIITLTINLGNYQSFDIEVDGQPVSVEIPTKITGDVKIALLSAKKAVTLTIALGEEKGFLPFSSLVINAAFDFGLLNTIIKEIIPIDLPEGDLATITEEETGTGQYTYTVKIEEALRGVLSAVEGLSDYKITLDKSTLASTGDFDISLYTDADVPMGDVRMHFKEDNRDIIYPSMAKADKVLITSYEEGHVKEYKKLELEHYGNILSLIDNYKATSQDGPYTKEGRQMICMSDFTNYFTVDQANIFSAINIVYKLGLTNKPENHLMTINYNDGEGFFTTNKVETTVSGSNVKIITSSLKEEELTADLTVDVVYKDSKATTKFFQEDSKKAVATVGLTFSGDRPSVNNTTYTVTLNKPEQGITITPITLGNSVGTGKSYGYLIGKEYSYRNYDLNVKVGDSPATLISVDEANNLYAHVIENVTSDQTIDITLEKKPEITKYSVDFTYDEENITLIPVSESPEVDEGDSYVFSVQIAEQSIASHHISVRVNEEDVEVTADSEKAGLYHYTIEDITKNTSVIISLSEKELYTATVVYPEESMTIEPVTESDKVYEGGSYTYNIQLDEEFLDYVLSATVNGKISSVTVVNREKGQYKHTIKDITEDITVVVSLKEAEKDERVKVTITLQDMAEGITFDTDLNNLHMIIGDPLTIQFRWNSATSNTETTESKPIVLVDGKEVDYLKVADEADLYEFTIPQVSETMTISIKIDENPSGILLPQQPANEVKVTTATGVLYVENNSCSTEKANGVRVSIYTLTGQMKEQRYVVGTESFLLARGIYIVKIDNKVTKVIIK